MKIGVIGAQCTGKSTYISDFLENWKMYKKCEKPRYSDLIKEKNIGINENGNEESQKIILNSLCDQIMYTPKDDNVIFDRSVLDNLVHTLWLNANNKVSDAFVKESITIVKETLTFYDILFFMPITKYSPVPFEPDINRSNSAEYRDEIDNLFKALVKQYNNGNKTYFPFDHKNGCPAIIELFGDRQQRIELTKMYITDNGTPYSEEDSLIQLTPEELEDKQALENVVNSLHVKNNLIIPVNKKTK